MITRRAAIRNAVLLLGGAVTATQLGSIEAAFAATGTDSKPRFLDPDQLEMTERIADLIIPETDTPGAVSAGVPGFIDVMLAEWASPETQQQFVTGFASIDELAEEHGLPGFARGSAEQQAEVLQALDREAFADGAPDTFFRRLKRLVLFAYFSSEPGATQALRFDPFPGDYHACLPLDSDDRAWFWLGYGYDL